MARFKDGDSAFTRQDIEDWPQGTLVRIKNSATMGGQIDVEKNGKVRRVHVSQLKKP